MDAFIPMEVVRFRLREMMEASSGSGSNLLFPVHTHVENGPVCKIKLCRSPHNSHIRDSVFRRYLPSPPVPALPGANLDSLGSSAAIYVTEPDQRSRRPA